MTVYRTNNAVKSKLLINWEKHGRKVMLGGYPERAIKKGVSRENREGWQAGIYVAPRG